MADTSSQMMLDDITLTMRHKPKTASFPSPCLPEGSASTVTTTAHQGTGPHVAGAGRRQSPPPGTPCRLPLLLMLPTVMLMLPAVILIWLPLGYEALWL